MASSQDVTIPIGTIDVTVTIPPPPPSQNPNSTTTSTSTSAAQPPQLQKDTEDFTIFLPGDVLPSKRVKFQPEELILRPNNHLGSLAVPEHADQDYNDMLRFIWASPIKECIAASPDDLYYHYLQEFWWSCDYHEATQTISGTICQGSRSVSITADSLRPILLLPQPSEGQSFEPVAPTLELKAWLRTIGYFFNQPSGDTLPIPSTPKKSHIPGVWRLLFTHVIQCLGGNSGSFDQANAIALPMIHALATGRRVDYTALIFKDMVSKVTAVKRSHSVPFTRFFSLVFLHELGEDYHAVDYAVTQPARIGSNVYKQAADARVAPLTPYMVQVLKTSYPDLYPNNITQIPAPQSDEPAGMGGVDTSLPQETGVLANPPAPSKVPKRRVKKPTTKAKSSTLPPLHAEVKLSQQGSSKGTTSKGSSSSLPKDDIGHQPNPSAASKQAADETKGQQQATTPTSVGGVGEEQGSPQPNRGQSPIPISPSSQPTESQPEHAESPAALEAEPSAANEFSAQQHAEEEAPLSSYPSLLFSLNANIQHATDGFSTDDASVDLSLEDMFDVEEEMAFDEEEETMATPITRITADPNAPLPFTFITAPQELPPSSPKSPKMPSPPQFPTKYIRPSSPAKPMPQMPAIITDPIPPFDEDFDEEILMELPPVTHPDFLKLPFHSSLPLHTPNLDSLLHRATAEFPAGPATTYAGPEVFTRVQVPGLDYVQTRSITYITDNLKNLISSTNKQAHIIAWLADQQGKLHQDFEETSMGQALQSHNIRDSVADIQRMSEVLSANQLKLFELSNEVLRGNQEMLGHRLKRLSEAQSQVDKKLEDVITYVKIPTDHSSISASLAGVIPAISELQRSIILLAAQFNNADRRLHPLSTLLTNIHKSQETHLTTLNSISSSITKLTTHIKTSQNNFTPADRTLLQESVKKQKTLEDDVKDIKSTLSSILQLLQSGQIEVAAKPAPSKGEKGSTAEGEQGTSKGEQPRSAEVAPLVNVVDEIPAEPIQPLRRKGKLPAVDISEPSVDVSDKVVRKVIRTQRASMQEGSSSQDEIDERLLAAAQGVSIEYVRQQRQKEKEEEASRELIAKIAQEELLSADECTKKLATEQNLTPQDLIKRQEAEYAKNKQKEKEDFQKRLEKRKRPEKITGVQASVSQQGKSINVVLTRHGARVTEAIDGIKKSTLGATEWIEVHDIIKDRTGANLIGLHKIITEYFDNIRKFERKFGIKDSLLAKVASSTPPAPRTKKRKVADISTFLNKPIDEEGDERLDVSLPAGFNFQEGKTISDPPGIFYTSIQGVRKFFRVQETDLASTRFLVLIKKLCARTSNDENFIKYIENVLDEPERKSDPALKKIKQEYMWD